MMYDGSYDAACAFVARETQGWSEAGLDYSDADFICDCGNEKNSPSDDFCDECRIARIDGMRDMEHGA